MSRERAEEDILERWESVDNSEEVETIMRV